MLAPAPEGRVPYKIFYQIRMSHEPSWGIVIGYIVASWRLPVSEEGYSTLFTLEKPKRNS